MIFKLNEYIFSIKDIKLYKYSRNLLNMTLDIARLEKHFFLFPLPWKEYNFKRLSVNRNCIIRLTNIFTVFPPSPINLFI